MKKIMLLIILTMLVPFSFAIGDYDFENYDLWAEDNSTTREMFVKVPDDEWPSQVVFDTIQICYQGTINWLTSSNPNLRQVEPPWPIRRAITVHCFCVLDKLRTKYKFKAWTRSLAKDDPKNPKETSTEFSLQSTVCVKEHNTLAGLVVLPTDNETIKLGLKEQEGSESLDSIPEPPEEPIEEDASPTINF
jgi:hypothetical protein